MKRKNRLIALVAMLVLMMQMTGCGGAAASGSENVINTWAGYEADAANGLRVKSVEFRTSDSENVSKVTYDVEGNITSSSIYHVKYEPFFEKVGGISAPFQCRYMSTSYAFLINYCYYTLSREGLFLSDILYDDYTLQVNNDGSYVLVYNNDTNANSSYHCLADGRLILDNFTSASSSTTANYNYDNIGRVTEYSWIDVKENESGNTRRRETNVRCTYVGDSSYLESIVYDGEVEDDSLPGNLSHSDEFFKKTYEYDYDDNDNIVRVKQYILTDKMQINGTLQCVWEYEYDENGNVVCETKVTGSDEGDIVMTTRYQYDNDGNVIEECEYETFGSEEYMTSKTEYQYVNAYAYQTKTTSYKYEANSDYSIVNLINTEEGVWGELIYGEFYEGYDEVNDCWTVTYYTQEEIDQYMHDQEFQRIN